MFKPHNGICICHNKPNLIVVKAGYCARGNQEQKNAKKKARGKSVAPYRYVRKPTGELPLFEEIWNERQHVSFINGEPIHEFDVSCFAHVLPKAQNRYPKFKLNKDYIILITADQHYQLDHCPRTDIINLPEWQKFFELEKQAKLEYKQLYEK